MKKIYLLEQEVNSGYDTYDSMVIIADSEKEAILLSYVQASMLFSSVMVKQSRGGLRKRTSTKDISN